MKKTTIETNVTPKKRGRPRKEVNLNAKETVEKRGRGRPRKNPIVSEPEVKRGRGRPRKNIDALAVKAKNPVGRPRKYANLSEKELKKAGVTIIKKKAKAETVKPKQFSVSKPEIVFTSDNERREIIPDAGESCVLDKFANSLSILKQDHEVFGTYSYDFKDIDDELYYLLEDYDIETEFYNSSENKFSSIEEAYADEQTFALQILTDFFRDRLAPRVSNETWTEFSHVLRQTISDTVAVEMRLYHMRDSDKERVYFIHSVDWPEVERQIMPILENMELAPKPEFTNFDF